jgi:hypothetical protein
MAHGQCTFRQTDLTRVVKAVEAAGVSVQRVEVGKDGRIVVITGKPQPTSLDHQWGGPNDWADAK